MSNPGLSFLSGANHNMAGSLAIPFHLMRL